MQLSTFWCNLQCKTESTWKPTVTVTNLSFNYINCKETVKPGFAITKVGSAIAKPGFMALI